MTAINYDYIQKFLIRAKLTHPLHVGSAAGRNEEVLVHPVMGRPFIQASGIAGPFRAYFSSYNTSPDIGAVFGISGEDLPPVPGKNGTMERADDVESRISFTDGYFVEEPVMELRPRVKIDPVTGSVASEGSGGQKFNTEYIGAGAVVEYAVYLYGMKQNAASDLQKVEEMLTAISANAVQFGGMKSTGSGYMEIIEAGVRKFDMKDSNDRRAWAIEDELVMADYEPLTISPRSKNKSAAYTVTAKGRTEGSLLVKSIAVPEVGEDAPDAMNIRNAAKEYIVPGSSFKGAVRSRIEIILSYLKKKGLVKDTERILINAFGGMESGHSKDEQYTGHAGNLRFFDIVVGTVEDNDMAVLQHRIHIDKLTGGVIHGGKFSEKNIAGAFAIEIDVIDRYEPDEVFALLVMALRDLMIGTCNLGSGYSVGKGFLDIDEVLITRKDGKKAVVTKEALQDPDGLISVCMKALSSGKEKS